MAPLHATAVPRRTRARVFAAFQIAAAKTTAKTLRYCLESQKETPAKPRTAKLPASRSARRVAARQDWQDRLAAVGADTVDARQWTRQHGHPHLQGLYSVRVCCGDERRACCAARGGAPPLWPLPCCLSLATACVSHQGFLCHGASTSSEACASRRQPQPKPARPPAVAGWVAAAQLVAGRRSRGGTRGGAGRRANTHSRARRQALARARARAQALAGWLAGVLRLSQRCPRWLVCWRAHAYARALAIFGVKTLQPKRSYSAMRNTK